MKKNGSLILGRIVGIFLIFHFLVPMNVSLADEFFASEALINLPYAKTFTISAYYSPLPCQQRYVTGSYEGDIKLNGRGTNGADGTQVYPGMIAAPKNYVFGTKMDIPGIGIAAVHDRGGAIQASNGQENVYDRLDIWMGYGDKGLARALNWGKRTTEVVIYGVNESILENVGLADFSQDEANPGSCEFKSQENFMFEFESSTTDNVDKNLSEILSVGASGSQVVVLQKELKLLNYFRTDVTGYYGDVTENAVFKFQQSQGLVGDKSSLGAGMFGRKTRDRLNEIIASRNYNAIMVAKTTDAYLASNPEIEEAGGNIAFAQ